MDHPSVDCPTHGNQTAYVTANRNAYCPMCLIQGHAEHIKESTGVKGLPRVMDEPDDYSTGRNVLRVLEQMHEILHPHGDPDHEWDSEITDDLASLVYTIIPRPPDDRGAHKDLGYNLRQLRERVDELKAAKKVHNVVRLESTIDELARDLDTFNERHLIIPSMHASDERRKDWLTRKFIQCLTQHDGACLDNEAERETVADYLADVMLAMSR
jgi:hypothetical protein